MIRLESFKESTLVVAAAKISNHLTIIINQLGFQIFQ